MTPEQERRIRAEAAVLQAEHPLNLVLAALDAAEETARTEAAAHDAWQARAERAEAELAAIRAADDKAAQELTRLGMEAIARAEKAEDEHDAWQARAEEYQHAWHRDVAKGRAAIAKAEAERDEARAQLKALRKARLLLLVQDIAAHERGRTSNRKAARALTEALYSMDMTAAVYAQGPTKERAEELFSSFVTAWNAVDDGTLLTPDQIDGSNMRSQP